MRAHLLPALCLAIALTACSRKDDTSTPAAAPAAALLSTAGDGTARQMAYEHSLSLDAPEERIAAIHESAQAACSAAADEGCVVLESRLTTGQHAFASIKFRARPKGIRKLIAAVSGQGQIINQSTTAEDLAAPLEDSAKKLAMLQDYRSKLEALRGRAAADIDALIKVNRELAQVQSDIESTTGKQAHLVQRVETETLTLNVSSRQSKSFWKDISNSLARFASDLSTGIASVITGLAYLLPWGVTLMAFVWAGRALWLRRKRARAGA